MTAIRVRLDDREVKAALRELARLGRDPSPPLKALGPLLVASTRDRITREVSPDGTPFEPLNLAYASVEKKGPGILRERAMRGGLFASLASEQAGKSLRIGTNKIYAAVHQFGATIEARQAPALVFRLGGRLVKTQSVEIPARPYLGISEEDREEILHVFGLFIRRAAGAPPGRATGG
jgi:phage virion morphogenesis protein